jgi:hypothetical protein
MGRTVAIATTISTTIVSATAATSSSVIFLPSASYLDGPVLALAFIVLGLVLHHVALTKHIAIGNRADVAEYVFAAVGRFDKSKPARIPPCGLAFEALAAAVVSSASIAPTRGAAATAPFFANITATLAVITLAVITLAVITFAVITLTVITLTVVTLTVIALVFITLAFVARRTAARASPAHA